MFIFIEFHIWDSWLKQICTTIAFLWFGDRLLHGLVDLSGSTVHWPPPLDCSKGDTVSPYFLRLGSGSSAGSCLFGWPRRAHYFFLTSRIGIHFVIPQRNCSLAHNLSFSPWVNFLALISQECKLQELCKGRGFCLFSLLLYLYHQHLGQCLVYIVGAQ